MCLREEPASLYLYGDLGPSGNAVLEAIYDGPIDQRLAGDQPVILEKLPTLADGDLHSESVAVGEGDIFWNPETRQPENLRPGDPYLPAGCASADCAENYGGGRVRMDQWVAEYRLKTGILWSDGQPLLASDSVYSYGLDADPATPSTKFQVDRTYAYESLDDRTTRWTGVPGLRDFEAAAYFWSPLPEHAWGGIAASELASSEMASRSPMGWGAYQVKEWLPGQQIRLDANPAYFRAAEGLPHFERLLIRFLGASSASGLDQLRTTECDVLGEDVLATVSLGELTSASEAGEISLSVTTGPMERLEFRVLPTSPLSDPRVRRALASCIDREGMSQAFGLDAGPVPRTFLVPSSPDARTPAEPILHDPASAGETLEAVGWIGEGAVGSGPRQAQGVTGFPDGSRLALDLLTTADELHGAIAGQVVQDLAACGAEVHVHALSTEGVFAPWPDGAAFGGTYDLVLWAWPGLSAQECSMFAGWEVPGGANPLGVNASGWADPDFDHACSFLISGSNGEAAYSEALQVTQDRFAAGLPALPLFLRPRMAASRQEVCGLGLDPAGLTVLADVESVSRGAACP